MNPKSTGNSTGKLTALRVELLEVTPPVWREFVVPHDISLARLHALLQRVMGWTNSHLHEFEIAGMRYAPPDPEEDFDNPPEDSSKVRLAQLDLAPGDAFTYLYDFGDGWEHEITIVPLARADFPYVPCCMDGAGACPPEDCGGPPGYADMIEILADSGNPEYADMREWVGADFDPARFDIEAVNAALRRS